jgi:hypothetical protein
VSRPSGAWKADSGSWTTWTKEDVQNLVPGDRHFVRTAEGIGVYLLVRDDGDLTIETRAQVPASLFAGLRATRRVPRGLRSTQ